MAFVQLSNISVSFGEKEILSKVTLTISSSSRTALSGSNGSGKTSLLKIIAGLTKPDSGTVTVDKGTRLGYLPQEGLTHRGISLKKAVDNAFDYLHKIVTEMDFTAEEMQHTKDRKKLQKLIERNHELQEKLLKQNYYNRDEKITQVLIGLGFKKDDFNKQCDEFSGGWQMRIALAKALLSNPDILLLDEPTNYLDLEARTWLEKFLKDFKGGVLVVSHDRYFLDVTVDEVIELFNGKLKRYRGNYSAYEKTRAAELESLEEQYRKQQEERAKHEDFINRFRYNASKASLVQSRMKILEKIVPVEIPENLKKMHFKFPDPPHSGKQVLTISNLSKSYGNHTVFTHFSLPISRGEKIVIAGANGAGKTTLLKILSGNDTDYTGKVLLGTGVRIGYFSQDLLRFHDKSHTILQELEETAPTHLIPHLRSMLGAFLFRGDDIYKSLTVLSGGEKSRLALLQLLLFPVNLLILDEPTNHLDIHSKDILLDALRAYTGTLVFVSHDRYFIENIATRVIDLTHEGPVDYQGDYTYFLWKKNNGQTAETDNNALNHAAPPQKEARVSAGRKKHHEHKQTKNLINRLRREEELLLETLETLENQYRALEEDLARPENYSHREKAQELKQQMDKNLTRQEETNMRWEEIDNELKKLEKNE